MQFPCPKQTWAQHVAQGVPPTLTPTICCLTPFRNSSHGFLVFYTFWNVFVFPLNFAPPCAFHETCSYAICTCLCSPNTLFSFYIVVKMYPNEPNMNQVLNCVFEKHVMFVWQTAFHKLIHKRVPPIPIPGWCCRGNLGCTLFKHEPVVRATRTHWSKWLQTTLTGFGNVALTTDWLLCLNNLHHVLKQ